MQDLDLIALICSRLCHDLVGPVGAVSNGVEVMAEEDDPQMREQALDLLGSSAELALSRLKFYRLAFGASGGAGASIGLGEARQAAADFLADSRAELDWPAPEGGTGEGLNKGAIKVLLNLVLLASEAIPRGGSVSVRLDDGGARLTVRGQGPGARLADAQVLALRTGDPGDDLQPKASPALLVARLAASLGGTLRYEHGEDQVLLAAELPAAA